MSRDLTADDCRKIARAKHAPVYKAAHHLIQIIQGQLHLHATMNQKDLIYEVPAMMCDYPSYKMPEMIEILKRHFSKNGFYVRSIPPNVLFVSFRHNNA